METDDGSAFSPVPSLTPADSDLSAPPSSDDGGLERSDRVSGEGGGGLSVQLNSFRPAATLQEMIPGPSGELFVSSGGSQGQVLAEVFVYCGHKCSRI